MEQSCGNIYRRKNKLGKGQVTQGHTHNFDHLTIVFTGGIHIKAKMPDGSTLERDFFAPSDCLIRADVEHEITALMDDTEYWCIYSHRFPQGQVSMEETGWMPAYR